jgi:hypothetical protein
LPGRPVSGVALRASECNTVLHRRMMSVRNAASPVRT